MLLRPMIRAAAALLALCLASPAAESAAIRIACGALDPAGQAEVKEELTLARDCVARMLEAAPPRARPLLDRTFEGCG